MVDINLWLFEGDKWILLFRKRLFWLGLMLIYLIEVLFIFKIRVVIELFILSLDVFVVMFEMVCC